MCKNSGKFDQEETLFRVLFCEVSARSFVFVTLFLNTKEYSSDVRVCVHVLFKHSLECKLSWTEIEKRFNGWL
jgi:hypothetical protein